MANPHAQAMQDLRKDINSVVNFLAHRIANPRKADVDTPQRQEPPKTNN